MQPPSLVTIIISTYNRAHLLKESLTSIKNQSVKPFQIIIIDDGSCDSTEDTIKSFPLAIDYIKKKNSGKSSSINNAANLIKGDSIIVFDDDDTLSQNSIQTHLEKFKQHPNINFTYSSNNIGISTPKNGLQIVGTDFLEDIDHKNLFVSTLYRCQTLMQGMLIRREAFEATLPFNETLTRSQDYDFMLRLMLKHSGKFIETPTFTLREHTGVRGSRENNFSSEKKMIKWLEFDRLILLELFKSIQSNSVIHQPDNAYLLFGAYAGRALWKEATWFLNNVAGIEKDGLSGRQKKIIHGAIRKSTLDWITRSTHEKTLFINSLLTIPRPIRREVLKALLWQSGSYFNFAKKFIT